MGGSYRTTHRTHVRVPPSTYWFTMLIYSNLLDIGARHVLAKAFSNWWWITWLVVFFAQFAAVAVAEHFSRIFKALHIFSLPKLCCVYMGRCSITIIVPHSKCNKQRPIVEFSLVIWGEIFYATDAFPLVVSTSISRHNYSGTRNTHTHLLTSPGCVGVGVWVRVCGWSRLRAHPPRRLPASPRVAAHEGNIDGVPLSRWSQN